MNLLLVAYYYDPFPGVGAQRISYWAKNIKRADGSINVSVVTATPGTASTPETKVYYLDNTKLQKKLINLFKTHRDEINWSYSLEEWLKTSKEKYDVVLFTGGPFLHFRVAKWLKKHTNSKIVFDFRDPMSNNPRAENRGLFLKIKRFLMSLIERGFVKNADLVISVNPWCLDLIRGVKNMKTAIIDNGYDENTMRKTKYIYNEDSIKSKTKLVYAGRFYHDRNPEHLLELLDNNQIIRSVFEFHYVGPYHPLVEKYENKPFFVFHGLKTYEESINIINQCDYGLIFSYGHPFESTTKVFDYIGLRKPFLVFFNEIPFDGALIRYSKEMPGSYVIKNSTKEIELFFKSFNPVSDQISFPIEKYSRQHGLIELLRLLNNL